MVPSRPHACDPPHALHAKTVPPGVRSPLLVLLVRIRWWFQLATWYSVEEILIIQILSIFTCCPLRRIGCKSFPEYRGVRTIAVARAASQQLRRPAAGAALKLQIDSQAFFRMDRCILLVAAAALRATTVEAAVVRQDSEYLHVTATANTEYGAAESIMTPSSRHRKQSQDCDLSKLDATIEDVDRVCCITSSAQSGHRRTLHEEGPCSRVPDACSPGCGAVFAPFFDSCHEYLAVSLGESLMDQLGGLYGRCRQVLPASPSSPPPITPEQAAEQFATIEASVARDPATPMVSVASPLSDRLHRRH